MFPILLVSQSKRTVDTFVKKLAKEGKYSLRQIQYILPDPNIITIDQIRLIKSNLNRLSENLIIVIYNFDSAKNETQNAFLKTLEEKNERVQFILQISSESSVLSTIVSRCKTIKIKSTTTLKNTDILPFTELLGIYGDMTKEKAIKLCDEWLHIYHEKIHADDFAINHNLVKEILRIKNLIVSNNLNAQLAIDHLILQFKK